MPGLLEPCATGKTGLPVPAAAFHTRCMANWYGTARTNYFRVRDVDAFKATLALVHPDIKVVDGDPPSNPAGSVALIETLGEGWPSPCDSYVDDGDGACDDCGTPGEHPDEYDILDLIAEHLVEGDVAVTIVAGAERTRYVTGRAVAINSAGDRRVVSLDDIYPLAAQLGTTVTAAAY